MADLGQWTGGAVAILPTTSWAAPASMVTTEDRNDSSIYTWTAASSRLTLPSSGLADGYLMICAFEFEDTSNGRHTPQGKWVQNSGTGTFVSTISSGYNRDNSEDRSYVMTWGFVDGPSASATFDFQWQRDGDIPTGGTVRSIVQVIPLYYDDWATYQSTDTSLYGGTTPTQVTGFTGTNGTNITISTSTVTLGADNKRYLVLGGFNRENDGSASRTQRWVGLDIDGTFQDDVKAYGFRRNASNDRMGQLFTTIINRVTTDIDVQMHCYRGDGTAANEGGAGADANTPSTALYTMVFLELKSGCEVFQSTGSTSQAIAATAPVDLQLSKTSDVNLNDSASFTRASDTGMNAEQDMDCLFGANISGAASNVSSTNRFTAFVEPTVNGTENTDIFNGHYLRNSTGADSCFGWGANLLAFQALNTGDDLGISASELSGTEDAGTGNCTVQPGWASYWGINLDTMNTDAPVGGGSTIIIIS